MMRFLVHWLSIGIALAATAELLPSVAVSSWEALIIGSLAIGLVNALVRPVLALLTLPITILTLGLFYLLVNAASFALAAWFVSGFQVNSLGGAVLGALLVSVLSGLVQGLLDRDR